MNDWNGSISEESFDTDGGKGRGEGQRRGGGIQDDTTAQQQQLLCPSVFVAMLGQPECISVVSQRTKGLLNRSLGWNASGGTRCSLPKERIITLFPNVLTKGAAPQDLVNWLKDNPNHRFSRELHDLRNTFNQFLPTEARAPSHADPQGEDEASKAESMLPALSPTELLARALGFPGCDFDDEPSKGTRSCTLTKKMMLAECQRRIQRKGKEINRETGWQYPSSTWRKQALAGWLRQNVVEDNGEKREELRRVMRLAAELNGRHTPTMNIWEYRPFTDDNANIVIIGDKASTQHPEAMVETMKEAVAMDIRLIPFID